MDNDPEAGGSAPENPSVHSNITELRNATRALSAVLSKLVSPAMSGVMSVTTACQTTIAYLEAREKDEADIDLLKTIELCIAIGWALSSVYSIGMDLFRTFTQASYHAFLESWRVAFGLSNFTKESSVESIHNNVVKNLDALTLLKERRDTGDPVLIEEVKERFKELKNALSQSLDILAQRAKGMGFAYHTELFSQAFAAISNVVIIGLRFKSDPIDLIGAKIVSLVTSISKLALVFDNFIAWKARLTNDTLKKLETINDVDDLIEALTNRINQLRDSFEENPNAFEQLKKLTDELKNFKALREHLIKLRTALGNVAAGQQRVSDSVQIFIDDTQSDLEDRQRLISSEEPTTSSRNEQAFHQEVDNPEADKDNPPKPPRKNS
jgi:methyl-accepting chemotaxis protein